MALLPFHQNKGEPENEKIKYGQALKKVLLKKWRPKDVLIDFDS